jgi:hypothetical protein
MIDITKYNLLEGHCFELKGTCPQQNKLESFLQKDTVSNQNSKEASKTKNRLAFPESRRFTVTNQKGSSYAEYAW